MDSNYQVRIRIQLINSMFRLKPSKESYRLYKIHWTNKKQIEKLKN